MDFLEKKHRVPEVVLESLSPTSQAAISRLQDHLPEPFDLSVVIKYTSVYFASQFKLIKVGQVFICIKKTCCCSSAPLRER